MTLNEFKQSMGYFLDPNNGIGCALYFIVEEQGVDVVRFADIENTAKNELRDRFLDQIRETIVDNDELHYMPISRADDRRNVVYEYDLAEQVTGLEAMNQVLTTEEQPRFTFTDHSFNSVKGYVITLGNDQQKIALYKKHFPINVLKQGRFLLMPDNERLVKIPRDALAIDKHFDFVRVNGTLVVVNIKTLERSFGFERIIRAQADTTITAVEGMLLLNDIDQLRELAADVSVAKKLMRIRNSPVLTIPVQNVIAFIRGHVELAGKIEFNEGGDRVILRTQVSKRLFLKVLNDDYLFSQLTQLQYESHAKDKLVEPNPEPAE